MDEEIPQSRRMPGARALTSRGRLYLLYALAARLSRTWISRRKSRLGADPAREYPAATMRASGLRSAGVPIADFGFAACTFPIPSGIPVRRIKVTAERHRAHPVCLNIEGARSR
jgi:hypothetical protein